MKFLAALIALSLTFLTPADAVQKRVVVKKIEKIATLTEVEFLIANKSSIITIANIESTTSDVVINSLELNGASTWSLTLDSDLDEIALAATSDRAGNIWLAGFSASAIVEETTTPIMVAENPDLVVTEPSQSARSDLNRLTIWKVAPDGQLSATYYSSENLPGLINSISVSKSGLSILGQYNERSFIQSMNLEGSFGNPVNIGSSKTVINVAVRNSDGSSSVFGSSSETLGGKKLAGKQDGVLVKVTKSGSISNVVRSSATNAQRTWLTADSKFLLSGYVKVGKKIESAITKFSPTFVPKWTIRVPSTGESSAITAGKSSIVAISSNSQVSSIFRWKPAQPSLLLLTLDSKGLITGASGATDLSAPIALSYSQELGVIGLARTSDNSVVLFRPSK